MYNIHFRSSADILVADSLKDLTPRQEEQFFQSPMPAEKTPSADNSALLPIVHAQRERFRQRNEELEDAQARHLQQGWIHLSSFFGQNFILDLPTD